MNILRQFFDLGEFSHCRQVIQTYLCPNKQDLLFLNKYCIISDKRYLKIRKINIWLQINQVVRKNTLGNGRKFQRTIASSSFRTGRAKETAIITAS